MYFDSHAHLDDGRFQEDFDDILARMKENGVTAMMNIGCRPTFDGETTTLEVHIIGYEGDLYGSEISVNFVKRLRSERKFASEQELQSDRQQVLDLLG